MSKRASRLRGIGLALLWAGVAATAFASDKYDRGGKIDGARRPAPGQALVYFVRPQFLGAAIKTKLFADGELLSILGAGTWTVWEGPPGKHEFATESENAGLLEAELAADRIYFVQVAIHMGAMKARTNFEVVCKGSEAEEEVGKKYHEAEQALLTDEGRQWVAKNRADIDRTIAKYRAKGEEIEYLKPEDGAPAPPWK